MNTWIIITAIATSVSALGSFTAAFIALYISSRDRKANVEINARIGHVISAINEYETLSIDITNISTRPVIITGIRIRTGMMKRKYFAIIHLESNIIDFPKRINDGETIPVQLPYEDFQNSLAQLIEKNPNGFLWFNRRFIKFIATSTIGDTFVGKTHKLLCQEFRRERIRWKKM